MHVLFSVLLAYLKLSPCGVPEPAWASGRVVFCDLSSSSIPRDYPIIQQFIPKNTPSLGLPLRSGHYRV